MRRPLPSINPLPTKFAEIEKFGRLTPTETIESRNGRIHRLFVCDCGKTKMIYQYNVFKGATKSCGCIAVESAKKHMLENRKFFASRKTHGHTANRQENKGVSLTYQSWCRIKQRCSNPKNDRYKYYGARGIFMSKEWSMSFEAFLNDMGERPDKWHTIDRIDNELGYFNGNCRWVTWSVQAQNRKTFLYTIHNGEEIRLLDLCKLLKEDYKKLHGKLSRKGLLFRKKTKERGNAD